MVGEWGWENNVVRRGAPGRLIGLFLPLESPSLGLEGILVIGQSWLQQVGSAGLERIEDPGDRYSGAFSTLAVGVPGEGRSLRKTGDDSFF